MDNLQMDNVRINHEAAKAIFYERYFNKLNNKQKLAIEKYLNGEPSIVVGVPGSGKTRMLVALVLALYFEGEPLNNVLCVTYTNKGRNEMRERVGEYLKDILLTYKSRYPQEVGSASDEGLARVANAVASTLNVETFHSFALSLVQRYGHRIGKADYGIADDLDIISIVTEIIDSLPAKSPILRRKEPYYAIRALIELFSLMKRERITPAQIIEAAQAEVELLQEKVNNAPYIAAQFAGQIAAKAKGAGAALKEELFAQLGEEFCKEYIYLTARQGAFQIGDCKTATFQAKLDKLAELQAAAMLLPKFDSLLNANQLYTFDDIIAYAIKILSENDDILGETRERYLHLLVDEMQDTSEGQDQILRLILQYYTDMGLPVSIFRVGDDDQMLFEYSGVRLDTMTRFMDFCGVGQQDLTQLEVNYRSSSQILEAAINVINTNELRLMGEKQMIAAKGKGTITPQICEYEHETVELADVMEQIKKLIASGVEPSEIAVLYRAHRQVEPLLNALEGAKIPYNIKKSIDILSTPIIKQIMMLLDYFRKTPATELREGEAFLWQIMVFPFIGIPTADVFAISILKKLINDQARFSEGNKPYITLRELIMNKEYLDAAQVSEEGKAKILAFAVNLEYAHSAAINMPTYRFICKMLDLFGIQQFIELQEEAIFLKEVLYTFLLKADALSTKYKDDFTLRSFATHLENMTREHLSMQHEKVIEVANGINLMAVHAAKGGEWDYVFGIGITVKWWEKEKHSYSYALPETMSHLTEQSATKEQNTRLLYVLISRAKKGLFLSYHTEDRNGFAHEPSNLLMATNIPFTKVIVKSPN